MLLKTARNISIVFFTFLFATSLLAAPAKSTDKFTTLWKPLRQAFATSEAPGMGRFGQFGRRNNWICRGYKIDNSGYDFWFQAVPNPANVKMIFRVGSPYEFAWRFVLIENNLVFLYDEDNDPSWDAQFVFRIATQGPFKGYLILEKSVPANYPSAGRTYPHLKPIVDFDPTRKFIVYYYVACAPSPNN